MRYENDYWNDNRPNVLPFEEYAKTVQSIIDNYDGRLDLDIFMKGVLDFEGDPNGKQRTDETGKRQSKIKNGYYRRQENYLLDGWR